MGRRVPSEGDFEGAWSSADRTNQGQWLKQLSIVDEYTRQCIALDVGRKMTSEDVIDRLIRRHADMAS
ncbi:MAG: hypothetical protein RIS70_906 [Planctomycetota bacterium]